MKAGVLQQVGDPQFLYDNPDNIFVAGFIGSPPMNMGIATGRAADGDGLAVRLGSALLAVPESRAGRASGAAELRRPRGGGGHPQRGHGGRRIVARRAEDASRLQAKVTT